MVLAARKQPEVDPLVIREGQVLPVGRDRGCRDRVARRVGGHLSRTQIARRSGRSAKARKQEHRGDRNGDEGQGAGDPAEYRPSGLLGLNLYAGGRLDLLYDLRVRLAAQTSQVEMCSSIDSLTCSGAPAPIAYGGATTVANLGSPMGRFRSSGSGVAARIAWK